MSKNIVVLAGSPRKNGNTDKLAASFIDGAKSAGKTVTLFRVADMKIGGCLGCRHCFEEKGVCVRKDDMQGILDALLKADALVLASPVYYFGVTAQLKLAIDRTFALLSVGMPVTKAALLMTSGGGGVAAADGAVTMFEKMCAFSEWDNAGTVIAGSLMKDGEIDTRGELEQAWKLGAEI
jgi:multimeric flavodoxin WrbA